MSSAVEWPADSKGSAVHCSTTQGARSRILPAVHCANKTGNVHQMSVMHLLTATEQVSAIHCTSQNFQNCSQERIENYHQPTDLSIRSVG
jgi:hypothetical protein